MPNSRLYLGIYWARQEEEEEEEEELSNNFVQMPNLCALVLFFCHSTPLFVEEIRPSGLIVEAATRAGTGRVGKVMMFPRVIAPPGR